MFERNAIKLKLKNNKALDCSNKSNKRIKRFTLFVKPTESCMKNNHSQTDSETFFSSNKIHTLQTWILFEARRADFSKKICVYEFLHLSTVANLLVAVEMYRKAPVNRRTTQAKCARKLQVIYGKRSDEVWPKRCNLITNCKWTLIGEAIASVEGCRWVTQVWINLAPWN